MSEDLDKRSEVPASNGIDPGRTVGPGGAIVLALAWSMIIIAQLTPSLAVCGASSVEWLDTSMPARAGWFGPVTGVFGWYANLTFLALSFTIARGRRPQTWIALLQIALTVSALLPMRLPVGNELLPLPVCGRGVGFWLWLGAQLSLAGFAIVRARGGIPKG